MILTSRARVPSGRSRSQSPPPGKTVPCIFGPVKVPAGNFHEPPMAGGCKTNVLDDCVHCDLVEQIEAWAMRRSNSKQVEHAEAIHKSPFLDDVIASNAKEGHFRHLHAPAGRRQAPIG